MLINVQQRRKKVYIFSLIYDFSKSFTHAYLTIFILITVTVARAVELKHNASLISALANETSKLFLDAANTLRPFKPEISAQWIKYLEFKAAFYQSYVSLYIYKKQ